MAKPANVLSKIQRTSKRTSEGIRNVKTSAMSKTEKRSYKKYRGQGK